MAMRTFASFDAYLKSRKPAHQRIIRPIRAFVKRKFPQLTETVKWGNGCWVKGKTFVSFVYTTPTYVQWGLVTSAKLKDPKKLLTVTSKYVRHVKVFKPSDINRPAFAALLRQVVRRA